MPQSCYVLAKTTCKLVAHCGDEVFLFQIHQLASLTVMMSKSLFVLICSL